MNFDLNVSDLSELDKEYALSVWSKRFSRSIEVLTDHYNFIETKTNKAKEQFKNETLSYGLRKNEVLDIYGTDLPNGNFFNLKINLNSLIKI